MLHMLFKLLLSAGFFFNYFLFSYYQSSHFFFFYFFFHFFFVDIVLHQVTLQQITLLLTNSRKNRTVFSNWLGWQDSLFTLLGNN